MCHDRKRNDPQNSTTSIASRTKDDMAIDENAVDVLSDDFVQLEIDLPLVIGPEEIKKIFLRESKFMDHYKAQTTSYRSYASHLVLLLFHKVELSIGANSLSINSSAGHDTSQVPKQGYWQLHGRPNTSNSRTILSTAFDRSSQEQTVRTSLAWPRSSKRSICWIPDEG